jgi:hypothetical protein
MISRYVFSRSYIAFAIMSRHSKISYAYLEKLGRLAIASEGVFKKKLRAQNEVVHTAYDTLHSTGAEINIVLFVSPAQQYMNLYSRH